MKVFKNRKKMKALKSIAAVTCSIVLGATVFSGCSSNTADGDTLTLTAYDANVSKSFGEDRVSQAITEKTGVTLEYSQSSGDAQEKLNLMLASNDYPDLILIGRSTGLIENFISAQALIPLEDLIDEYAPNIKEQYGEYLERAKSEDGHIYGLPNWYGIDNEPVLGFMFRKDLLAEVAPEEVVNGERYITQDELMEYLRAFKEKYPTIDGQDSVPMTLWAENWGSVIGTFKGMYGLKDYAEVNGELKFDFRDPKYKEMLQFVNSIYREGLLDREWATNKEQLWKQKLSSGSVFSTVEAYWNTSEATQLLTQTNPDAMFLPYKVVADGVDPTQTTYSSRNPMGWDIVAITKSNPDPVKTIQFLDFLASDEGQILLMSGVEGVDYEIVDGRRVMLEDAKNAMLEDFTTYSNESGVRYWTICVKNGNAKDGQPYLLSNEYTEDPVKEFSHVTLADTIYDCSPYQDLAPIGGSVEALNYQKITDLQLEYCTRLINASSEEEFENLWNTFLSEADALGAAEIESIINENYHARLQLWGME